ncbi:T-cell surface antigen CD2 isoform X2 [Catharus ustulatus]|uniref:Immunoglobulin V-set domain-containing protein n=1 Tax=Catharus ustulatus TaxID=91951 RepID=A0A8C3TH48_CATUS|nr:T-cell surface antigen CD2 isoform X2 [Catharus ustulatus]
MNFRRIFLVKCMLLLFPSVKCFNTSWVYRAVNETALLSIAAPLTPGNSYYVIWNKGGQRLVQLRGTNTKYFVNREQCRCAMLRNGTLQIQRLQKEDSGNYTVMVYQDGKLKAEEKTIFFVQEPVPQPILTFRCGKKNVSVKCEAKQKAKDEAFTTELTQPNRKKIQNNSTTLEWHGRNFGMFRCVVKNQVSENMAEKVIECPGKMDFYLILSIAGGAVSFVIFVICLIYCIRRKKAKRREVYEEERAMHTLPVEREKGTRELPQTPSKATPRQLRVQQRPLPPQPQEQPLPPRPQPRPRAQPRTPNLPRERP